MGGDADVHPRPHAERDRSLIRGVPAAAARRAGPGATTETRTPTLPSTTRTDEELEAAHELELARFEQERTTDLVRRQQQLQRPILDAAGPGWDGCRAKRTRGATGGG